MKLGIAEILENTSKLRKKEEQIAYLQKNDSNVLRTVIAAALDPRVIWALPEGAPPYKPNEFVDQESGLYNEAKRLYLFIEGGHTSLSQSKRESLFIQFLEILSVADARLMIAAKDKTIPYVSLTPELFNEAFPGLLMIEVKEPHVKRVKKITLTPKGPKTIVKKDVPFIKDETFPVPENPVMEIEDDLLPSPLPESSIGQAELEQLKQEALSEILG